MERIIGYHCAPALAGIKPANLVACYKNKGYDVNREIQRLNQELNGKDIYFTPLCECDKRVLLLVYRKEVLQKALSRNEEHRFLLSLGYPKSAEVDSCIHFLKQRFACQEFPHEIGVFLGYPMHDIYGFIFHKEEGCLLCGEWKVYQNPEEAQKMFDRFSACRKAVSRRILRGDTLARMFAAA